MNIQTSTLEDQTILKISDTKPKFVALNMKNFIKIVTVDDIVYLKSTGGYTTFYLNNDTNVRVCKNIGHYERLFQNSHFLRTHHSFLINVKHLQNIVRDEEGNYCEMNYIKKTLPISKRRFSFVKKYLHY